MALFLSFAYGSGHKQLCNPLQSIGLASNQSSDVV